MAAEETEKRLRAGRELWRAHSNHCSLMGFDPLTTPAPDPSTGLPMYYDPVKEEWNTRQLVSYYLFILNVIGVCIYFIILSF